MIDNCLLGCNNMLQLYVTVCLNWSVKNKEYRLANKKENNIKIFNIVFLERVYLKQELKPILDNFYI